MPSATTVFLHHIFVACLLWLLACFHSEVLAHFNFTAHMSQRPRKQQKLDGVEWQSGFALRCLGSARRISEQISKLNEDQSESALSASRIRHLTSERLHELGNTMTPYGRLVQKHSALGPDINFISPHALIHYCASKSTEFAKFHASLATNGDPLSIVFYMDGATAGSDLRPAPRKYENIYWSFMEYPSWFRGRKAGWMTFLTLKKTSMTEHDVSHTELMRFALRVFFNPDEGEWNFKIGVRLGSSGFILTADPGPFLADFEGIVQAFCLMGASGRKACPFCKNMLWRCDEFEDDYLCHLSCSEYTRFDLHTNESMREMTDEIEAASETLPPGRFTELQKNYGISYNPEGLPWDRSLRDLIKMPHGLHLDWQHIFASSGGVGQYHLNAFVHACENIASISGKELDEMALNVKMPSGQELAKDFFSNRVSDNAAGHVKAFASEVISAVSVLALIIQVVLIGELPDEMQEHVTCLLLLESIFHTLRGADAPGCTDESYGLHEMLQLHHELFLKLYPDCFKPKLHLGRHLPAIWRTWKRLLNCFGPERHHKDLLMALRGCVNTNHESFAIAHELLRYTGEIENDALFAPSSLVPPVRVVNFEVNVGNAVFQASACSRSANTPVGIITRGELVHWRQNGTKQCGVVNLFLVLWGSAGGGIACIVGLCRDAGEGKWARSEVLAIVSPQALLGRLPYFIDGDDLHPRFA